jgi:hypothetical protein
MVSAGRKLFHELTGGFRVVLDDQNATVATRHGLSPTIATSLSGFSSPENAWVAIITTMWGR